LPGGQPSGWVRFRSATWVRITAAATSVPAQLVPDNPKVGVDRANWYEPGLNRTYLDLATHYRTAILPARPRQPRDKAKVEVGVLVVERWILARLRNRRFFSLAELNQAIGELVADLNARPMRRLGVSRRDLFLELDRPALKELPAEPYEYAEWRARRVGLDYHVDIDGHYYSVPHRLIREQLDARITAHTIELFRKSLPLRRQGANASRFICAAPVAVGIPPSPSTCRARTGVTPNGRSSGSAVRRRRLARARPSSPRWSWRAGPILNRATALAWASCGWRANTAPIGWRRPAIAVWISVPVPTARSNRSSSTGSIDSRLSRHAKASCCPTTPTSAAPAITIEERSPC
jgi:hypothetical protein